MTNPVSDGTRRLRASHKMTQKELAELAGIPRATLANMEKPTGNPSISVVVKVAQVLGVPVEDLVTKEQSTFVTRVLREDMPTVRQDDGKYVSTSASPLSVPFLQINDLNMLPGCRTRGRPHPEGSHELFLCLEGTATVEIHDEIHEVESGNLIYFPGNQPHNYCNAGLKPVHAITVVTILSAKGRRQTGKDGPEQDA